MFYYTSYKSKNNFYWDCFFIIKIINNFVFDLRRKKTKHFIRGSFFEKVGFKLYHNKLNKYTSNNFPLKK